MPTGLYATQSDLEDIFGPSYVAAWSRFELSPSGAADTARIQTALDYADGEINAYFLGGPYAVPLVVNLTKPVVTKWAATLAGVWLYGNRSNDPNVNDWPGWRLSKLRTAIFADMRRFRGGAARLDAVLRAGTAGAPV